MVYSHPLYGRAPTALLTGRKQFPFRETIKIKLSVNSPKVTACNLITPEMRAVNPVKCHPPTLGSVLPPTDLAVRILQRCISSPHLDVFLVAIAAHLAMESQSRCSYLSQMQHSNTYQLASSHPLPHRHWYPSVQSPAPDFLSIYSSPRAPSGFPGENSVKLYNWQIYIHDFLSHEDSSSLWPM